METRRVETRLLVAKGSDGKIYDLHRISHGSRPKALGPDAPWSDDKVEWLTSAGALVETDDETTFRLGDIVMIEVADLGGSAAVD
ncbi:hypothetical protein [Aureimonas leprariae]|uniref:Uncharacterized protein n=1 Tax=Plantimonas leprariae TaxID=2615207 RepID=A0A7V7PKN0_9HYPH|nr:hypothetical protein [Aureimonas leprariae]KAB0676393.1 hypothetical protein F6X38_21080 [Aureimonas leprariae]